MSHNIYFYTKIEYADHREMIFPVADLVPNICEDLSVRDIRAIVCTSRDVHDMIAPFMAARTIEVRGRLQTCRLTYYKTVWVHLHRDIKHEIAIDNETFHTDVAILSAAHTGVITLSRYIGVKCSFMNKYYIYARDGMAQYGVGGYRHKLCHTKMDYYYVYATLHPVPFARFIDMFIARIISGVAKGGYNSNAYLERLYKEANAHGYRSVGDFIGSIEFMKIFAQW